MKSILYMVIGIVLVTIILPMLLIFSCDISPPDIDNVEEIPGETMIRVYVKETQRVKEIELEEYVKGVVASEMPAAFEIDALKAQAVAARTKALYQKIKYGDKGNPTHPGAEVCSDVHCQVYRNEEQLEKVHSKEWMRDFWPRIEKAVEETKGLVATYEGKLIDPLYHSTSGGKTENSEDVFTAMAPYLRSVESPYEQESKHLDNETVVSTSEFITKINNTYKSCALSIDNIGNSLKILQRSEGDRVSKIKVGNDTLTGRNIRELFGLKSANFKITISGDKMIFKTKGYGHGVGMSQYGANGMAKEGYTFEDILKHYYQGVDIEAYKR
ncbi:stage II sporulation protein D [Wukongibacter baidiensis]|uniref:stage II sporulation protein D n=1 Tax=Wukongibacter baidiensis TaxID=1723361 RepID=UPI003D7F2E79